MDPSNLQCPQVGSPQYRRLCQTLSVPVFYEKGTPKALTGLPATDLLILNELSDEDLIDTCAVNKYVNNLCNNDSFWLNRVIDRYGKKLGHGTVIRKKYIPDGTSWKEYYLWLSGLLDGPEDIAYLIAIEHDREDLLILLDMKIDIEPVFGFRNPIYINENLRLFLENGNFGPSDPTNPWSIPLNKFILAATTGITTRTIMTLLSSIYIYVNDMQKDPQNKQFLTSTPLMDKYFQETYIRLAAKPQRYRVYKGGVKKLIPKFDPKRFAWAAFQQIIADNVIKRDQLTQEELNLLKNPEIIERLDVESKLYRSIRTYYRKHKKTSEWPSLSSYFKA